MSIRPQLNSPSNTIWNSVWLVGLLWITFFAFLSGVWNEIVIPVILFLFVYLFFKARMNHVFRVVLLVTPLSVILFAYSSSISEVSNLILIATSLLLLVSGLRVLATEIGAKIIGISLILIVTLYAQWGVVQFIAQEDFGLNYLGESVVSRDIDGVAKFAFGNQKMIRSYGPFMHPNVLGGVLVLGLVVILIMKDSLRPIFVPIVSLTFLAIGMTFSRASMTSSLLCFLLVAILTRTRPSRSLIVSLIVVGIFLTPFMMSRATDSEDVAITERYSGTLWAIKIIDANPWWRGVGPGKYKEDLDKYLNTNAIAVSSWRIDHVHSVPLLIVAEWGLIAGLLIGVLVIVLIKEYRWLVGLVPLFVLDHYFVTQYAPGFLLILCLWLAFEFGSDRREQAQRIEQVQ